MAEYSKVVGSILFSDGLLGELQAKALIDELCAEGCPACQSPMTREGRFKCYCPKCDFGLELTPPGGDQN